MSCLFFRQKRMNSVADATSSSGFDPGPDQVVTARVIARSSDDEAIFASNSSRFLKWL